MAWTEQQALAFNSGKSFDEVESMNGTSQPTVEETKSQDVKPEENSLGGNVEPSTTETATAETSEEKPVTEETSTSPVTEENPEKVEPVEKETKRVPTQQEKIAHSFAREKAKRKEAQAKLDAKLKEIEALKQELEKYKGLTEQDFGGNREQFDDYRFNQRWNNAMVERLQKEVDEGQDELRRQENSELAETRLMNCFPDEMERGRYQMLVADAEQNFGTKHPEYGVNKFSEFLMSEDDKTILTYLQDSDNSPKLIRHFIMKPEAADRIMRMRNPFNKMFELKQLESRMLQMEKVRAAKETKPLTPPPVKKELPDTGKIIQNSNINPGFELKQGMSEADAIKYFKSKGKI